MTDGDAAEWRWLLDELDDIRRRKEELVKQLEAAARGSPEVLELGDRLLGLDDRERQLHRAFIEARRTSD